MKKWLLYIIMVSCSVLLVAQEDPFYNGSLNNVSNPMLRPGGFGGLRMPVSFDPEKKTDVGVQLGTSFSTDFKGGHAFSTMVSPELRYKLSKRFTIRTGLSVSNTEYGNTLVYSPYGFSRYTGNITQGMLYVSGDYIISPKVILSGTAYKEFSIDHSSPDNAFRPGYDGKGLIMNLRLMPTSNTTIEVGAEFYQGNNPWRGGTYNPFYGPFNRPGW
jgi:hypothetical protein